MRNRLAIVALALATTMAFGQANKDQDVYKTNQSGTQKITNGPVIEYTSDHSAMIAWSTKYPGGTYIAYGTDQNNLSQRTEKAWGGTNHRLEIKNLQPSTTYYFQVRSEDAHGTGAMGADVQSNVEQFKTVAKGAAPDKTNYNVGVNGGNATPTSGSTGMPSMAGNGQFEPVYRLAINGDHVYTTSASERSSLASGGGFHDEGVLGYLARSQAAGTQPLYRLSKLQGNATTRVYTANPSERQTALSSGYHEDGTLGYIATSQLPGTVPLHRMRAPNNDHVLAIENSPEYQQALPLGFQEDGIVGYIWQNQQ